MPAAQAGADDPVELRRIGRDVLQRTGQPEHPLAGHPALEEAAGALDGQPGQRPLDVAQRPLVLAAVADVRQPGLDLLGQRDRRGVPVLGIHRHRLQADRLERRIDRPPQPSGRGEDRPAHPLQDVGDVARREGAVPDQQAVERRPQAIDVAGRADPVQVARRPARGSCTAASRAPSRGGSGTANRRAIAGAGPVPVGRLGFGR